MENTAEVIQQLEDKCARQEQEIAELTTKLQWFEEQFRLSQQKRFGRSSEASPDQLAMFNEAESEAQEAAPELENIPAYTRKKSTGKREDNLDGLPVELIEYHLPEEEQVCSCCGEELHEMSTEVRRELEIIPAQARVKKHVCYNYACRRCQKEATETPVVTASGPEPVIPGSMASPSAVAHTIAQKFSQGLPLYRQEQEWRRQGLELSRQTLSNWLLKTSELWLVHLYEAMHRQLLKQGCLHADETTLQVLAEPDRPATSTSYMWTYSSGEDGPPIVLYDYRTTRASKHPRRFLSGFSGYLHVDGYAGYNDLPGVTLVGCWAHARRQFKEALEALPEGAKEARVAAKEGLAYCNRLFAIERELERAPPEERYRRRREESLPVLEEFRKWLEYQSPRVLPKSAFGKAIKYCRNQWPRLEAFLQDGRLKLDNNRGERAIRPFVMGRKNWLFSNTPRGAQASALIYSVVETAKANGLDPFRYLTYLFEKMPQLADPDQCEDLLPWSEKLPPELKANPKNQDPS